MNLLFRCLHCDRTVRATVPEGADGVACPGCGERVSFPDEALSGNVVRRCLVCPSAELFVRKDFPQRLGVGLFISGVVASSIAWAYTNLWWTFGILLGSAAIDFVLYFVVGEVLTCYRCHAEYRGAEIGEEHGGFDLDTHERHRQIAARKAASHGP